MHASGCIRRPERIEHVFGPQADDVAAFAGALLGTDDGALTCCATEAA